MLTRRSRWRECGWLLMVLALATGARGADNPALVAPTEPKSAEEQQKLFHLPPGFEIQLVAAEPEIRKPINLNFDARGRLFATQSVEYPFVPEAGATPRDEIRAFADTNGDGRLDQASTYAGGLTIPIGVLPLPDGALGYSIPNILRFFDDDGDGKADRREIAYSEFGFNDTHGMASSFTHWIDGWVYACHGFANTSTVHGVDGEAITMQSGNTYRLRPDGSRIEYHTHGQVNPFGLAIDPLGNVYSSDCHSRPLYMLLRGAWYPSFGKPHDGLGYGPEMIAHSHGSTGISGVVYYAADQFPAEYRETVFIGNPVTGRVNRDQLEPHGSTYKAVEMPDFLSCDDPWFRPVDLKLAPDGTLYIADFYNRIIGHYEVPLSHPGRDRERGRIWRVVYTGTDAKPTVPSPNLADADFPHLLAALESSNLIVRTHATHQLVARATPVELDELRKQVADGGPHPLLRVHGLWILARRDRLDDEIVMRLAEDSDRVVRVHLMKALAERADWLPAPASVRSLVVKRLQDDDAFVRRAAADALGRHPDAAHVSALLELWERTPADDTHLLHVVRMSLRDTLAALPDWQTLAREYGSQKARRDRLAEVALGARTPQSAAFVLDWLRDGNPAAGQRGEFAYHVIRHLDESNLPVGFDAVRGTNGVDRNTQVATLRAVARAAQEREATLPVVVKTWGEQLSRDLLAEKTGGTIQQGVDLARELHLTVLAESLANLAADPKLPGDARVPVLSGLVALDSQRAIPLLVRQLSESAVPLDQRQKAGELLGNLNEPAARTAAGEQLRLAPVSVALAIARGLSSNRDGGELLLGAISQGKASPRLLQDTVITARLKSANIAELDARLPKLLQDLPPEDERVTELLNQRRSGFTGATPDKGRGAMHFGKHCAACHRIGDQGNKVGPELDGVGIRGLDRLLEDLLNPNRNVDQAFRASVIARTNGQVASGLVLRKEGGVLLLVDEQGKEQRIPEGEIEEQRILKLSPMPANVAEKLTEAEFYDLVGFLLSQTQKPAAPKP